MSRIVVRHVKTGGLYEVMGPATHEETLEELTVYRSMKDGKVWARPTTKFNDGRFVLEHCSDDLKPANVGGNATATAGTT